MEERLENSLEQIIYILQERGGTIEYDRLLKTMHIRNSDVFYDINFKLNKLKELGYIYDYNDMVRLTITGSEFTGFGDIKHQKYLEDKKNRLNFDNIELQNESLLRQVKIDELTIQNLELQNRQLKRYVLFSIIGFLAGALLTNWKEIIEFFLKLIKQK